MSLNGGLFPTTDEPERGPGRGSSEDGRDARHPSPADAGTGSRVPGRQPADRPAGPDPRGGLRLRRPDRASVRLHPSREDGKGGAPTLPGQGHRPVARPTHPAPDPTPDHGRGRGSSRRPAAAVSAPLHEHRHRATRRGRRAPRHVVRASHTQALCPRLPSVRRPPVRTPGPHLQRPPVQLAALDDLSAATRGDTGLDAPGAGGDRRTAPAATVRTARLRASRFGSSGRLRWPQGLVLPEPRR